MTADDRDAALRWRLRRGMKELDIVLERFHQVEYPRIPAEARRAFIELLDCEDDDLWAWLTGRGEPEREELADAVRRLRRHAGL